MLLTVEELVGKVEAFAKSHIVPNLASDKSRFLFGFAWMGIGTKVRAELSSLPNDGTIRDESGKIDTAKLRMCIKNGFDAAGSVLLDERLPLRFTQEDADLFFSELE